jgi:hypothetical protein
MWKHNGARLKVMDVKRLPSLSSFELPSRERLLKTQDSSGGWAEHPGGHLSSMNTAEAILALMSAGVDAGNPAIQKGAEFLINERIHSQTDNGAWARRVAGAKGKRTVPDIIRTCLAVSALIRAGRSVVGTPVKESLDWLAGRQNNLDHDRGWGFRRGDKGEMLPTCLAIQALLRTSVTIDDNPWREQLQRALRYLVDNCRDKRKGHFGDSELKAAHTVWAVIALQVARKCGVTAFYVEEQAAIEWLLQHQDQALAPAEELVRIDPEPSGAANYGYMFGMESLLLQVLGESSEPKHRQTDLWKDVQRRLRNNFEENSGGFYGQRVFSWSTAAALLAIRAAGPNLAEIPARPAEYTGTKVGPAIMGFAVLLVAAVVVLTTSGNFGNRQAIVFIFLMLACLLAYGALGEKTFAELFKVLFGGKSEDKDK